MGEIIAFMVGSIFTLGLSLGCLYLVYKMLEYKETTDIRREEKIKNNRVKNNPAPEGGVIRPKTFEQLAEENDEYAKAVSALLHPDPKEE